MAQGSEGKRGSALEREQAAAVKIQALARGRAERKGQGAEKTPEKDKASQSGRCQSKEAAITNSKSVTHGVHHHKHKGGCSPPHVKNRKPSSNQEAAMHKP